MAFWLYLGLAILLTPPITIGLLAASLCLLLRWRPTLLQTLLWNKDAPVPQKAKQESMWWNWWPKGP
jgi:hypothetical protein